jgi:hypothetical protein
MSNEPAPIRYLTDISTHITRHFGPKSFVLHEHKSSIVHVDIHVVPPTDECPFFTLLTSGMSDLDMHVPEGVADFSLAELCLCLPGDWPLAMDNFGWREPQYFWPIHLLHQLARYPHSHDTWLSFGHTVGDPESPGPIDPQVDFTGIVLLNPLTFPEGASSLTTFDGRTINFLALIPLLTNELLFAQREGSEELASILFEAGVTEIIDPARASVLDELEP